MINSIEFRPAFQLWPNFLHCTEVFERFGSYLTLLDHETWQVKSWVCPLFSRWVVDLEYETDLIVVKFFFFFDLTWDFSLIVYCQTFGILFPVYDQSLNLFFGEHGSWLIVHYVYSYVVDIFEEDSPVRIRHRLATLLVFREHLLINANNSLACKNHGVRRQSVHMLYVFCFEYIEIYVVENLQCKRFFWGVGL